MALALERRQDQPGEAVASHVRVSDATAPAGVVRLTLAEFRSYHRLQLAIEPVPVVLTGPNGAGKTNLLEAISFLAPGRGLRQARLAEVDRTGGGPWAVTAHLRAGAAVTEVATGRVQDGARERRAVRIDGAEVRQQSAFADVARIVWLTPAMDRLFQEGASGRRRFVDRLVLSADPAHAGQLARYAHALRERANLLRGGRFDPAWLGALERQAAAAGVAVAAARRQTVRALAAALAEPLGPFPQPTIELVGEIEAGLGERSALDVEEAFGASLAEGRREDARTGTTAIGPHRSDLVVRDAASGRPARDGSTGEQKALLVSLVLAEARLRAAEGGHPPILLLDEVAAHLDGDRRAALFEILLALGAQAWLTGTDAAVFAPLRADAQFLSVRNSTLDRHDRAQSRRS